MEHCYKGIGQGHNFFRRFNDWELLGVTDFLFQRQEVQLEEEEKVLQGNREECLLMWLLLDFSHVII